MLDVFLALYTWQAREQNRSPIEEKKSLWQNKGGGEDGGEGKEMERKPEKETTEDAPKRISNLSL